MNLRCLIAAMLVLAASALGHGLVGEDAVLASGAFHISAFEAEAVLVNRSVQ
jgi:hypothetical protein